MKLEWSHTVLNIKDSEKIIEFYTKTLGFKISDRGPIVENGPEIIFVSQDPDEHHQLAFSVEREDVDKPISLNHLSFRVKTFDEVQEVKERLDSVDVQYLPLCHGNALSLYFNDPEGNGIEVFFDTPWDVAQPQGVVWDTNLTEKEALEWVERTFKNEPTFAKREESAREFVNRK
jgi:catechol-2,3-dioxygenase